MNEEVRRSPGVEELKFADAWGVFHQDRRHGREGSRPC